MGYLKGRFSSLRGLRQQISDATDHKRALAWVKTCIIIHTLISFVEREMKIMSSWMNWCEKEQMHLVML